MAEITEQEKLYQRFILKCWADEDFKNRLLNDAMGTLKAEGVELPEGITFNAVENTDKACTIIIPPKPEMELDDSLLDQVSGGSDPFGFEHAFNVYRKSINESYIKPITDFLDRVHIKIK